jgi:hypothetical protein
MYFSCKAFVGFFIKGQKKKDKGFSRFSIAATIG